MTVPARLRICALLCVALLPALSAGAGKGSAESVDDYYVDDAPVVLSATRLPQSQLEAPAAITLIDKDMIEASGAKNIVELFRLVPGMQVSYQNGHFPVVTYHGMASQYANGLQVLVDGRSVYLPATGGPPWSTLPVQIEEIERIEVIRGPNAASYGPNAFQGIINITTTHAAQDQGTKLKLEGGSREYGRAYVRHGGRVGDLDYRISGAHSQDQGFPGVRDSQRTEFVDGRLDYRIGANDLMQWNFGYAEGPRQAADDGFLPGPNHRQSDRSFFQHLRLEHDFSATNSLVGQFYYNNDRIDNDFPVTFGDQRFQVNDDRLSERFDWELQHSFKPADPLRLVWGAGLRWDKVKLPLWNGPDVQTNFIKRAFANLEWRVRDDVLVNVGALGELSNIATPDFSPRLGLTYLLSDEHSLRLIATEASRMPTLSSAALDARLVNADVTRSLIVAGPNVRAEKSDSIELGYHGLWLDRTLAADLKIFRQHFRKLEGLDGFVEIDGQPVPVNGNTLKADTAGLELQLDYRPTHADLLHVGYARMSIWGSREDAGYEDSVPHDSFNLLASHRWSDGWRTGFAYYYRAPMEFLGDSTPISRYQRADFMLEKAFDLGAGQRFSTLFTLQAALDRNDEFVRDNRYGHRAFLQVQYSFE